ncbi:MBL fold metallo-hydrolase [Candidatus Gottesmanbacteria bacterium]|nr:MBL fold metallo-hydrolase [Candidatus Gottesmanbacteria bacterium]
MAQKFASVVVLKPGYARWEGYASQRACGTITLIKSTKCCMVDLGIPSDRELIIEKLKENGLKTMDIDTVILTHSDIDHIGNMNVFPDATFIGGNDVIRRDLFMEFFKDKYTVDENIHIIHTPGHDNRCISVLVKTAKGIVAVTGDLFEYNNDWVTTDTSEAWEPWSQDKAMQMQSRDKIWKQADFIVPGHGDMFAVDKQINLTKTE